MLYIFVDHLACPIRLLVTSYETARERMASFFSSGISVCLHASCLFLCPSPCARESVASTRELLESGVVKWTKYEERLKQCQAWISGKETEVQTYSGLYPGLLEKQTAVEAFQVRGGATSKMVLPGMEEG